MGMQQVDGALVTAVVSVAVTILTLSITGIWKLTRSEAALQKSILTSKHEVTQQINTEVTSIRQGINSEVANIRQEVREEHDEFMHSIGESLSAIRQKATDVEIWNRDNFVRRTDFQNVVDGLTRSMEGLRVSVEGSLKEMNAKLDRFLITAAENNGKPRM